MNQPVRTKLYYTEGYCVLNYKNKGIFGYWCELTQRIVLINVFKNKDGELHASRKYKTKNNSVRFGADLRAGVAEIMRKIEEDGTGKVLPPPQKDKKVIESRGSIAEDVKKIGL